MNKALLIFSLLAVSTVANSEVNYYTSNKYEAKAHAYVSCAFYEGLNHLTDNLPNNEHKFMKFAAENYIKAMHEFQPETSREDLLIDFASYVSAKQAVLWDADPSLNSSDVKRISGRLYSKANCPVLLDAINE